MIFQSLLVVSIPRTEIGFLFCVEELNPNACGKKGGINDLVIQLRDNIKARRRRLTLP